MASVCDGLLDVCFCQKVPRLTLLRFLRPFQSGTYLQNRTCQSFIQYRKCRKIRINLHQPTITGYDGNITSTTIMEAELLPAAMQLLIPQDATLK